MDYRESEPDSYKPN